MTAITLFSGSYCDGDAVAAGVAAELGYPLLSDRLLEQAAARHGVDPAKLRHSMEEPPTMLDALRRDRPKHVAYIREALAEQVLAGDFVYHGYALHLIPRTISHVLKICLIANHDYRLRQAQQAEGLSERKARRLIDHDDSARLRWTQHLYDLGPWDERLYDMIVAMQSSTVEQAVGLICENARKPILAATPQSQAAAADFLLAARVNVALAEQDHDVDVTSVDGEVTVLIKKHVLRLEHLEDELKRLASAVDGVKAVRTRLGPKYRAPSVLGNLEVDSVPRVLLVDDEKEFVHTLSERLETRDLGAAVAYSGEDALSFVDQQEPEVMVLDLKMPGIDGIEVLRRVKRDHPQVEVIILTGHGSEREEEVARALGAFAYLQKPVDIDLLAKTMRAAYQRLRERAQGAGLNQGEAGDKGEPSVP